MKNTGFLQNLTKGKLVEDAVVIHLQELLPDYKVINTPQSMEDEIDRIKYSLIDVVVLNRYGWPVLGIECKRTLEKYNACKNICGWDGDYNTPLNRSSLRKYKEANFPVWIININEFCHKVLVAPLQVILASPNDAGRNMKWSGEVIYNVDSRSWNIYEGDFTLKDILADIIRKMGL